MSDRIRVLVGEDSYLLRAGILQILEAFPQIDLVGAEGDLSALRTAVDREQPDVLITDIRMPPTGHDEGIKLADELAKRHPDVGVVVLSEHARLSYAEELFRSGNPRRAYILKQHIADPEMLVAAIESVAQGRPQLDPEIVDMFVQALHSTDPSVESLTERERQVLALLAEGATNTMIATELVITRRAVERHVNSIFSKLALEDSPTVNRRVLAALIHVRSED
jgi:DNA-binding NarL/FixJ family response regulator